MKLKTYCRECNKKTTTHLIRLLIWILFRIKNYKPLCVKCIINWNEMNTHIEDYSDNNL